MSNSRIGIKRRFRNPVLNFKKNRVNKFTKALISILCTHDLGNLNRVKKCTVYCVLFDQQNDLFFRSAEGRSRDTFGTSFERTIVSNRCREAIVWPSFWHAGKFRYKTHLRVTFVSGSGGIV